MIDYCFRCGIALEWLVDDYVFRWTVISKTGAGQRPFCRSCSHKATMDHKEAKERFTGQQTFL